MYSDSVRFLCLVLICFACQTPEDGQTRSAVHHDADIGDDVGDVGVNRENHFDAMLARPHYPLDDELRLNHLQALGTHNSYHLQPDIDILPWRYSHLPLDEQLDVQGVRQFELDIYESETGQLEVYHLAVVDARSTCADLTSCLRIIKQWSDRSPGHHPVLVLLEIKRFRGSAETTVRKVENILEMIWTRERLVTPILVQRDYNSIAEGLSAEGWPTLGAVRGKLMAVLHAGGELRDAYLAEPGGTAARLMFPDAYGNTEVSFAAYHSMNNPLERQQAIRSVVSAGHMVRTRADADGAESESLDFTRANAALASGAHFISTDFPRAPTEGIYGFVIPQGSPSRCNPVAAPTICRAADIEQLE